MFLSQLGHALRRRTLCKHHMFVMLRVLGELLSTYKACLAFSCVIANSSRPYTGLDQHDPIVWQRALTEMEARKVKAVLLYPSF